MAITGASSGIGEAAARQFGRAGAELILISDHAVNLSRVLEEILQAGSTAIAAVTDLGSPGQVEGLLDRLEEQMGPIDTLINNAGIGLGATVLETQPADLHHLFEVNFFALVALCQQALRLMTPRRSGHIVNVTSAAARVGSPSVSIYSATKGAVHAFTQAFRIEAASAGVRVSECLPISVRTRFFENARGERYQPVGIVLSPEHVAGTLVRAAASRNPPAEILPFRPVRLAFALEALNPNLASRVATRAYQRDIEAARRSHERAAKGGADRDSSRLDTV